MSHDYPACGCHKLGINNDKQKGVELATAKLVAKKLLLMFSDEDINIARLQ